jgi:hypothetical protein
MSPYSSVSVRLSLKPTQKMGVPHTLFSGTRYSLSTLICVEDIEFGRMSSVVLPLRVSVSVSVSVSMVVGVFGLECVGAELRVGVDRSCCASSGRSGLRIVKSVEAGLCDGGEGSCAASSVGSGRCSFSFSWAAPGSGSVTSLLGISFCLFFFWKSSR